MNSPLLPTYARADVVFERGEGVWLVTRDGERYLDFGAGIAVNSLGHAHPHLVAALTEQAGKLWHTSNLFRIPDGERLAQRLVDSTFADLVFFTNSGAEALEASIKMARKYHSSNGEPERFRIVTFEGAFHGRTLATIAAGGQKKYLEGFGPKVVPWTPTVMPLPASLVARHAPIGKPPPMPLAIAMMSGAIPLHSWAKSLPVRPTPVCTSSKTRSMPRSSQSSRRPLRHCVGTLRTPPSPCKGSTRMAPVAGPIAAFKASWSPNGT